MTPVHSPDSGAYRTLEPAARQEQEQRRTSTRLQLAAGEVLARASSDLAASTGLQVLLVEHDPRLQERIRALLGEGDLGELQLEVRDDLSSALALLETDRFHVVVLDLELPEGQGLALLQALRAHTRGAIVVLEPAAEVGAEEQEVEYVSAGAQELVRKDALSAEALARALRSAVARLRYGQHLGGYELMERIAAGAMGEVWRARHRLLARPAAVKLIREQRRRSHEQREADVLRFRREAQAIARLTSPHTVTLYDFGLSKQGDYYYVMELLTGLDLDTLVSRYGALAPERAVHLVRQVSHSLGEAHQLGLVHRDIKPANIMACKLGFQHDFAKVLDFGIVKGELEGALPAARELEAFGTPGFVAPEVALPNRPVTARADVYSLGCLSYFLLTGRHVFEAKTLGELVLRHSREPAPPPSGLARGIPPELDRIVLRCLEKAPRDRYADAGDLLTDLEELELPRRWTRLRAKAWWIAYLPHLMDGGVEHDPAAATAISPDGLVHEVELDAD
ncbi:MAG: protein kinase [Planctomycetota bacterium]